MLMFNKFFLALAFIGGSAAAQASKGNADASRIDYGKTSEKTDRAGGMRRSSLATATLRASWTQSLSQRPVDPGYCVTLDNLSATHNGVKLSQENQLGHYDVKMPLASAAKLFDASFPVRGAQGERSLSLSDSAHNYLPVHHVL